MSKFAGLTFDRAPAHRTCPLYILLKGQLTNYPLIFFAQTSAVKTNTTSKRRQPAEEKGTTRDTRSTEAGGKLEPSGEPMTRVFSKGFARTFSGYASMWGGGPH